MNNRWAPAFTIVELIITLVVLAILAALTISTYNNVTKRALSTAAQSDLRNLATTMQRELQLTGSFPTSLPASYVSSAGVVITLQDSGAMPHYDNLSTIQTGVLFSEICAELVEEGAGKGVNQGGEVEDYITGCGNWNDDSMQVTGWDSRRWDTPVAKQSLIDYGANFTANNNYNRDQERVMETFYREMVERFERQGGSFPITSFWDYWATPQNGGVQLEPLDENPPVVPYFCADATVTGHSDVQWFVSEEGKISAGTCAK